MSRYDELNKVWDDRGYKAYANVTDRPRHYAVIGTVAAVFVVAVIVLSGWWIGWWFKGQNQTRTDKLYQKSYGNQSSLRADLTSQIGLVLQDTVRLDGATGKAARGVKVARYAVVGIACNDAAQIIGGTLNTDQQNFVTTNCDAGAVKPTSPYAH